MAWKGTNETNVTFQVAATLKGHTRGVTSLVVGGKRLYSGSMDHTIRVSCPSMIFPCCLSVLLWIVIEEWYNLIIYDLLVLSSFLFGSVVCCKLNNCWQGMYAGSIVFGSISNIDNLVLPFCFILDFSPLQILNRTHMMCSPSCFLQAKITFHCLQTWVTEFFIFLLNVYDMMLICFELI